MVRIIDARFPDDLATVRMLLREYAASLPVDLDFQDFETEVATLPGKYARPPGRLLLAYETTACSAASACVRSTATIAK